MRHSNDYKRNLDFIEEISYYSIIIYILKGGMYVFQIFDYYAASRTLLFVGLFECIAISYFYGK